MASPRSPEFIDEFLGFYENGVPKGVSTGSAKLDEIYRVMPGMLTVVTGITNHGKSEVLDQLLVNLIQNEDWKFALYSPENYPMSLHMIKLAEKYTGKPFDKARWGHMELEEAQEAALWMNENFYYINPRGKRFSVDEILERTRVLIYRHGINGLVIDPWNYVRKDFGTLREDQYINEEVGKLVTFTRDTGIPAWLVVHPRTLQRDPKTGEYKVPSIMELSGGSKFGDNADFVVAVERNAKEATETGIHQVTIHCEKSRYRYAAHQGNVTLFWNPFNGRIEESTQTASLPKTTHGIVISAESAF
jgi:twinkle protein